MMLKKSIVFQILLLTSILAYSQQKNLTVRFDEPTSLDGKEVWKKSVAYDGNRMVFSGGAKNPDREWESQSLPIGNGNLGANILGSVGTERITFNEKTLWRGGPNVSDDASYYWDTNKESAHVLKDIRAAFEKGDNKLATKLTQDNFLGSAAYSSNDESPFRFGSFTTAGEFYIETGINEKEIKNYRRELSLDSALATVKFEYQDTQYERDFFISYPDNVMVIKFSSSKKNSQNLVFEYAPNPLSSGEVLVENGNTLVFNRSLNENKMQFVVRVQARHIGGDMKIGDGVINISKADEVVFVITADTDYKANSDPDFTDTQTYVGVDPEKTTASVMRKVSKMGYGELFDRHYDDYTSLFNRVSLSLNNSTQKDLPTNKRLEEYRKGSQDFGLEELYFQFGRYLLIASSRPGNLPANLQGMWHNNVDGPWRMDYHNNINVQMNYWPSGPANLNECQMPLIDWMEGLVKPGARTAKSYFGARGWTASISGNIFGFTSPLKSKDMSWNFSPMAGPWLATHVWDHYDFTRDKKFLKERGYALIKSSAEFAVDYLWKRDDGSYTAAPSTSPEHGPIDKGATYVHAVINEILLDAIAASEVLDVDQEQRKEWKEVLENIVPYEIGRYGQLMEWSEDIDDPKNKHRHVNHLFSLHPGRTISPITTPELAEASRVVLNHRGDLATGWSIGWKLNQWARLYDGDRSYKLYGNLLKTGTLDNLWDIHPPFQIDGNFGGTAGVTEMLVQSHMGFIHLLPSLPSAWSQGEVKGLCTRGNFEVSIKWKAGELVEAVILSKSGENCIVRYKGEQIKFETKKGRDYKIEYKGGKLSYKN